MGENMSSKPQDVEFLAKFRCVEERKEGKAYTIYNCDAYGKINKDNIKEVIEQTLAIAQQLNAVIRLFRVIQLTSTHSVSITVTRGGMITIDIRFPPRIGGFQNVLSVRIDEIGILKALVEQLSELVQGLVS
jgi:hypothetical protein